MFIRKSHDNGCLEYTLPMKIPAKRDKVLEWKASFEKKKQTNSLMVFAVVLLFSKIILPRYNHCISVTGKDNTNLKILFADWMQDLM